MHEATTAEPRVDTSASSVTRKPSPVRLLVFDLDGTLIDSSTDLCNSVNAALQHVGCRELPAPKITSFIGSGAAILIRRALSATLQSAAPVHSESKDLFTHAFRYFLEYYHEHKLDTTRPYPGVIEALGYLRSRQPELPMAVLTNKPVRPSREICAALGLASYFFAIYGGDSFAKKPNPEGLLAIIEEANAITGSERSPANSMTSGSVVMVGDSEVDVQTARNCGVRSLGCSYGLAPAALELSAPDLLVKHPAEWAQVLQL